jgi:hypothetical protein
MRTGFNCVARLLSEPDENRLASIWNRTASGVTGCVTWGQDEGVNQRAHRFAKRVPWIVRICRPFRLLPRLFLHERHHEQSGGRW